MVFIEAVETWIKIQAEICCEMKTLMASSMPTKDFKQLTHLPKDSECQTLTAIKTTLIQRLTFCKLII